MSAILIGKVFSLIKEEPEKGGAKTLYLHFLHDVYDYIAQFTNDGIQPTCDIVEGGGLSSLRRKIEREGGSMMVDAFPEFTLTVTLPMKGGDAI